MQDSLFWMTPSLSIKEWSEVRCDGRDEEMYERGTIPGRLLYLAYCLSRPASIIAGLAVGAAFRSGVLARHFLFQVRRDAKIGEYVCSNGRETYLVSTNDDGVGRQVFSTNGLDFDKFETAAEIFRECRGAGAIDVLVDVGANIGTIAVPAVKRGFVDRAIAIEPEKNNFRLLRCNLLLNDIEDRVVAIQTAAGDQHSEVTMEISPTNSGDNRIRVSEAKGLYGEDKRPTTVVRIAPLDDVIEINQHALTARSVVWIDIQGYEVFALKGLKKQLSALPVLVIEFWPYGIMRAGSHLDELLQEVAGYSGFFDLRSPHVRRKISELSEIWSEFSNGNSQTDLVFV